MAEHNPSNINNHIGQMIILFKILIKPIWTRKLEFFGANVFMGSKNCLGNKKGMSIILIISRPVVC